MKKTPSEQLQATPDISEKEIRDKATEVLQGSKESSAGGAALAIGGLVLGGVVLSALLSQPKTRFKPAPASTARKIGESIRLRRTDLGLTQRQLAEKSGTRERFISEVERGKETAEVGKILDLLDALGLEARLAVKG